jgi:outer membrane protein assembly factor BamB
MKLLILFILAILCSCEDNPVKPENEILELLWKIEASDPAFLDGEISSGTGSFVTDNEAFYFHNTNGRYNSRVYKISFNGEIEKSSPVIGMHNITKPIYIIDNKLFTTTTWNGIYCLDKSSLGILYKIEPPIEIHEKFIVDNEKIYYSHGASLRARPLNNGLDFWLTEMKTVIPGQMAVDDSTVYVPTVSNRNQDGFLYFVNKFTGEIKHSAVLPFIEEYNAQMGGSSPAGTVEFGDYVYVGAENWFVYCFDKKTGEKVWEYQLDSPSASPLVISDGMLFTATLNSSCYAIDIYSGDLVWHHYDRTSSFLLTPAVYKEYVVFTNGSSLIVFNKNTGKVVTRLDSSTNESIFYFEICVNKHGQFIVGASQPNGSQSEWETLFMSFQLN